MQAALEEVEEQEMRTNRFDVDRIREDFPILKQRGSRATARLSGQRRDLAETAGRD